MAVHIEPIMKAQEDIAKTLGYVKNLVRGKATQIPMTQVIAYANRTLTEIKAKTRNMLLNLPSAMYSPSHSEKKRFLDLIFGIVGTAFGIANSVEIAKINTIIAKEIHRTDMLVDVVQLHGNHLHSLDVQINNSATALSAFVELNPAAFAQGLNHMIWKVTDVQTRLESAFEQAQLHRLSPQLFTNDVLESIKANIDETAERNGYISFVKHTTDLFQIPMSYVYQPGNQTISFILHIPLVKPEYLLDMHQYLPFPLSHNLSPNHSLTPAVGQNDILAYSGYETYKVVSQTDLAACHKMGGTYFCKGRNDLRTDIKDDCMGSLFLQLPKGVQTNCKFEIKPDKEQVFKLAYNKWTISTQKQYTTHQVCGNNRKPIVIGPGATITLKPGCRVRLEAHILTADSWEETETNPTYFSWAWNASEIFPDLAPNQFSSAMQSLRDYGLHIVDAADIAHHLKFNNFNDPAPKSISDLFDNPLHFVTIAIGFLVLIIVLYFGYQFCKGKIHDKLKATLPSAIAIHIPASAPPAYSHNNPQDSMPMVNLKY